MPSFEVKDMTCGHCASTITRAVQAVDGGAEVQIDLATHRVRIGPTAAGADVLEAAIRAAGYAPIVVTDTAAPVQTAAPRRGCGGGGGCGCH